MARIPYPAAFLLTTVSYYAVGWASLRGFALINASASPVWPPTGIAIAALLLGGYRLWPALFIGAVGFNYATSGDLSSSLVIGSGNTLEALLGTYLTLRFCRGQKAFSHAPSTLAYALWMMVPTALSASVGVLALVSFGLAPAEAGTNIWLTWWLGDYAGALVIAPLIVLWRHPSFEKGLLPLLATTVAFGWASIFWLPAETILLAPILIAWASTRHAPKDMALVTTLFAAIAIIGTLSGKGLFSGLDDNQSLLELQIFLAFFSVLTLILAAGSLERKAHGSVLRRVPITVAAILPLILLSIVSHNIVRPSYEENQTNLDEDHLEVQLNAWEDALAQNQARLEATAAFFEAQPNLTRAEFHAYVERSHWLESYGGLQAIGFNRYVPPENVAAFQAQLDQDASLQALGYPEIEAGSGVVIDYLAPIEGNEAAFGFDISSEPIRNAAVQTAIRTGEISVTAPVILVQEQENVRSTLNMMPVYLGHPTTEAEREAQFYGLIVTVHRGIDAAAHIGFKGAVEDLDAGTYFVGGPGNHSLHRDFTYAGRDYRIHVDALQPDPLSRWSAAFVLGSGGLLSVAAAMAVYAYDSTTRRAHQTAAKMTARLDEAQNLAKIGAWEWDIPNDEVIWSPQLFAVFGQDPETFKADFDGYVACLHPDDREQIQGIIYQAFETGKPFSTDHRVVWPDGTVRWVHGQGEVTMGPKGPVLMRGTAQDVTERIEAEQAKQHAASQAQELQSLRRVDEFKTQFLNTAAHELRTPLSPILMQLFLLQKEAEGKGMDKHLEVLDRNIKRLSELVNDFLTTSQFQAGRLAINPAEVNLATLIQEVAESFHPNAEDKGLTLETHHEGPETFNLDSQRIQQVLYNLLSNALKFTKEGSITIESRVDQHKATIQITDTGNGMTKESMKKLFAPFMQVHDPMTMTERGSGLGLYICKAIVEGHEGTIKVESAGIGKGSTFIVTLPAPPEPKQG